MPKVTYSKTSPYGATRQSNWAIGRYQHRRILPNREDTLVVLKAKHHLRPEVLSQELYGTPEYWWVFQVRNVNVLRDSIWDFEAGKTIWAPSLQYIRTIIG